MLRADAPRTGQHLGIGRLGQARRIGLAQLQLQAFGHVARADACRIERLQQCQRRAQLVQVGLHLGRQPGQDLFQGRIQVAVLVQFVDQQTAQRRIARRGARQRQLPQQVFAQGIRARRLRQVAVVVGKNAARTGHLVQAQFGIRRLVGLDRGLALGVGLLLARRIFVAFQQRILGQRLRQFGLQLQRRQLQQPDRLLQLRGQRQMLTRMKF
ncbi:Uncharacterised protein [Bordetella pertussis]|nr:Uncharacterised protein [Bordetella pertussis]